MARHIPLFDPAFECHKDIARLVKARVKPEIVVQTICVRECRSVNSEERAFVKIIPCSAPVPGLNKTELRHSIGIPLSALVPEKVAPIAYWLVREFKKQRPDLFQEGDVVVI